MLATLAASVFILTPEHLLMTVKAAVTSLLSVSNILFWFESGFLTWTRI
ncbi:hypothetical protein Q4526_06695 [Gilvimarinus sp. 2_MG-2023]|nr:hypothetical protein [Gilvimarinus sp. 2_MG-2023]MDO6570617.1 hypothetical protein [Gilvimarinus sp. 2_MG-2023]